MRRRSTERRTERGRGGLHSGRKEVHPYGEEVGACCKGSEEVAGLAGVEGKVEPRVQRVWEVRESKMLEEQPKSLETLQQEGR